MKRSPWALVWAIVLFGCGFTRLAAAQEPILAFRLQPASIVLQSGSVALARLEIENPSIREGDDVAVSLREDGSVSLQREPESLAKVGPFETGSILLEFVAGPSATVGTHTARLEVLYTYCIGDLCFQIAESVDVPVSIERPPIVLSVDGAQTPSLVAPSATAEPPPSIPRSRGWLIFVGLGIAAGLGLFLARKRTRRWALAPLAFLAVGILVYGIAVRQHEQAQSIGAVLCISCVGLEDARTAHEAEVSDRTAERLRSLNGTVHLIVFSATWCHACPYAKEMVALMADISDGLTYEVVDVEVEPDRAISAGIVESDRTIVPAVVAEGRDDVIFGVERLEARLLELIEQASGRTP